MADDLGALREEVDALQSDTEWKIDAMQAVVAQLSGTLVTMASELKRMGRLLNEAGLAPAAPSAPRPEPARRRPEPRPPVYPDAAAWVDAILFPRIQGRLTDPPGWRRDWHRHPDVADRVSALWRAWESARAADSPAAMSSWFTEHYDKHVGEILDCQDLEWDTLGEWVTGFLLPTLERRVTNTRRWCNAWNEHREVVVRFSALWQSWEHARRDGDPNTMSTWYTEHLDRHLPVIFSSDGPFAGCSPQRHSPRRQLDGRVHRPVDQREVGPGFVAQGPTTAATFYDLDGDDADDDRLDGGDDLDDVGGISDDRTQEVRSL